MACSAPGCSNFRRFKPEGISFHMFPRGDLLNTWLDVLGKNKNTWVWTKHKCVCSAHFSRKDFVKGKKRILKPHAIPHIVATTSKSSHAALSENLERTFKIQEHSMIQAETAETLLAIDPVPPEYKVEIKEEPEEMPESFWTNPRFKSLQAYIEDENSLTSICRICFQAIVNDVSHILTMDAANVDIKIQNKVKFVLPDIDLDVFANSVICKKCVDLVNSSIELREKWVLSQERLQQIIDRRRVDKLLTNDIIISVSTAAEESQPNPIVQNESEVVQIEKNVQSSILFQNQKLSFTTLNENKENFIRNCGNINQSMAETNTRSKKRRKSTNSITCSVCKQTLPTISKYITHSFQHPELKNRCYRCNECLQNARRLFIHLKVCRKKEEEKDRPLSKNTKYLCEVCKKEFLFAWYLERHVKCCTG